MSSAKSQSVLMFVFAAYLVSPVVYATWLYYELCLGTFPVDGDSIGIPIAGFLLIWGSGLVIAASIWLAIVFSKITGGE